MSNEIRYDPLIARYLAEELDARLRGRGCTAAPFFAPDLSVTLPFEGNVELRFDLHPRRGWARLLPAEVEADDLDAICTGVAATPDERRIVIDLDVTGRFRDISRSVVIELHTNQWNAIVIDRTTAGIVNVLRGRRAGDRALFPGQRYAAPPPSDRVGCTDISRDEARMRWMEILSRLGPEERRKALLATFAYTGALNASWILEAGNDEDAFERWWWLRSIPPASPGLLGPAGKTHPYPLALDGRPFEATPTLLEAMDQVAGLDPVEESPARSLDTGAAGLLVRERLAATERKIDRLRAQLEASQGEAETLRTRGDLLLARMHTVGRGVDRVELEGWEGETVAFPVDPELGPAENANRFYEEARRKQRAQQQIPGLILAAEAERAEWLRVLEQALSGVIPDDIESRLRRSREGRQSRGREDAGASLPYRIFRTSGGIEVRVGRNSKDNDRLTFGESSPNDVWLHARSVPGSHVILRWSNPDGAPPARDLMEAAQLAAVFSRARTSGLVAVDWTRRKHVRKPRGGPPGLVIPQRVRTLMVEPDETILERLAPRVAQDPVG